MRTKGGHQSFAFNPPQWDLNPASLVQNGAGKFVLTSDFGTFDQFWEFGRSPKPFKIKDAPQDLGFSHSSGKHICTLGTNSEEKNPGTGKSRRSAHAVSKQKALRGKPHS